MANPVNNNGFNVKADFGQAAPPRQNAAGPARVTQQQGQNAFDNVNETFAQNPNHAGQTDHAEDAPPRFQNKGNGNAAPPGNQNDVETDDRGEGGERAHRGHGHGHDPDIGEDGRPDRGHQAKGHDDKGGDGRGPRKGGNNGETPPIIVRNNDDHGGDRRGGKTNNTPPIIVNPNDNGNDGPWRNGRFPGQGNGNNKHSFNLDLSLNLNLRNTANQTTNLLGRVLSQVLRQNDVFIRNDSLNRLVNGNVSKLSQNTTSLIRDIANRVLSNNGRGPDVAVHLISKEIAQRFGEQIRSAAHEILSQKSLGTIRFNDLSLSARLRVAADLMPPHLPEKAQAALLAYSSNEVVSGFMLARGLVAPAADPNEISNLVAAKSAGVLSDVPIAGLRDVGLLVKGLIADTATAKSTPNLDQAVGKFVKILLANNELGVLLATISLAAAAQNGNGSVSRSLALSQIYELIGQLIQSGEKAAKLSEGERAHGIANGDRDDNSPASAKTYELGGNLRQYLEFNPAFMFDNSASAFNDPHDAREAQKDFVNLYHNDIEQWLKSGNHRLVKDFGFDRPVGIVVERGSDDVFTANTARFVLVRDGSVQGWHFLKAFLVK